MSNRICVVVDAGPAVEEAALAGGIEHLHLGYLPPAEYARANRG